MLAKRPKAIDHPERETHLPEHDRAICPRAELHVSTVLHFWAVPASGQRTGQRGDGSDGIGGGFGETHDGGYRGWRRALAQPFGGRGATRVKGSRRVTGGDL